MRVVTWNVWWRFGPWEERRDAILAVLRDLRPDVVGLQEVWAARGGENLAEWLAGELGMHWTWAASPAPERWQKRLGDPTVDIGNAVLSRWPITDRDVVRLPPPEDGDDGRLALHARLDAPSHQVPFFTTHLTASIDASATRCKQVVALAEFVASHRGGTLFPPVITGDFNAWPDSDEIRLFGGYRTAPVIPGQVFYDAWQYADPSAPSATWDPANPYVRHDPGVRVDYIHVGPPGPDGLGHVRSVRRAGDGPVDGVWPSDHAAVVADLATAAPAGGQAALARGQAASAGRQKDTGAPQEQFPALLDGPGAHVSDPRELLLGYLDWYREALMRKIAGLSDEQLRTQIDPLGWSPLGLVKHLGWVERRWLRWGFAAEDVLAYLPGGDDAEWSVPGEDSAGDVLAAYRTEVDTAKTVVAGAALADRARLGGRFRTPGEAPTLGRILFHLLQEYARHVGQLDVARELVDGQTGE